MPHSHGALTYDAASDHVARRGFRPAAAATADRVGVELEMLPVGVDGGRPAHGEVAVLLRSLGDLHSGTSVTFEPGGQVELSTTPADSIDEACDVLESDLGTVARTLADHGIVLVGAGIDPMPGARRVVHTTRYDAMDSYFGAKANGWGDAGRTMMCATAGLQVNLDLDASAPSPDTRWGLAHLIGPALIASFANSPLADGAPTGWKSYRQATWWRLDPSRTRPVRTRQAGSLRPGPQAWAEYAMSARVMLRRSGGGRSGGAVLGPFRFGEWLHAGEPFDYPTIDDLDYHLTTLFPPIRPRGWLELRMFDGLPDPWWRVPVAVSAALVYNEAAGEAAAQAAWESADLWEESARSGLANRALAKTARACFRIVLDVLAQDGASTATIDAVAGYLDRYVERGRCPADEVLEHWRRTGVCLLPGDLSLASVPSAVVGN